MLAWAFRFPLRTFYVYKRQGVIKRMPAHGKDSRGKRQEVTVKRTKALWLLVMACLFAASCVGPGRDGGLGNIFGNPRAVEGTWYLNGDRDKRTEVVSTQDGYEARNERGQTSRLEIGLGGSIRARDWENGLRGTVRRDSIEWENGTRWTRQPSGSCR